MTKASDLFVQALENEGVTHVFGIPGEENLDLLESLRESSIELVLTRHEQAAGFMAATFGRLTGRVGVCLATLGPGATNFTTSAAFSLLAGCPVLFITGQKPIKTSKQGRFQILDVVKMMTPITKLSTQIVDANTIPHLVRECFRLSTFEKPGPTHLELPEDIAAEAVDRRPFAVTHVDPPAAGQESIKAAATLLREAKNPIVVIGSGANRDSTHKSLRQFIDTSGLFFCMTQMGKGAVDERHPHCMGTTALSESDHIHHALEQADVILSVGHDVTEKPPFFMSESHPSQVIHLAFSPAQMDDVYFPNLEILGCMNANLGMLGEALKEVSCGDSAIFKESKRKIDEQVYAKNQSDNFPNIPQRIVSDIREAMPSNGILTLDNGMYKIWFARNYMAHEPNTILLDNALATMGAGLPAAIAAQIVHPDRRVACVCGDGGFMMNSQELETAVRLKFNLIAIVLCDRAYGMIKWKQGGMKFGDFGLDFGNPDFVQYAQSYGAKGTRISETGQLAPTMERCFSEGGVHVIEVPIDYSENQSLLKSELIKGASSSNA